MRLRNINQTKLTLDLMKILCICWGAAAAIILLWPKPPNFQQRWPLMVQPPMSLEMFNAAKKAAERPVYCIYRKCRTG